LQVGTANVTPDSNVFSIIAPDWISPISAVCKINLYKEVKVFLILAYISLSFFFLPWNVVCKENEVCAALCSSSLVEGLICWSQEKLDANANEKTLEETERRKKIENIKRRWDFVLMEQHHLWCTVCTLQGHSYIDCKECIYSSSLLI
jgi:hypothetical protein